MGALSAGGKNIEELWQSALQGRVRAEQYQLKKRGISIPVYRSAPPSLSKKDQHLIRHADRTVQLLLAAAREAWEQAQLKNCIYNTDRMGIIIGSSRGPIMLQEKNIFSFKKKPSAVVYSTGSSMAGILATAFSMQGPSFVVASTCTSGATALALGQQLLQSGVLDLVLVGGVDAPLSEALLEQYDAAGVLSKHQDPLLALKPFDRDRSGTVLGEGAAVVILESEGLALQRSAPILGRVGAVALQSHPGFRASLDVEGEALQQVLKKSLKQAGLEASAIGSLHLHGTGTRQNDQIESRAINAVFGEVAQQPLAWAHKAITGHVLGASPLFQLILALQTMRHRWMPAIIHCDCLDSTCKLRISRGETLVAAPALCLNSGFWGNVSSMLIAP